MFASAAEAAATFAGERHGNIYSRFTNPTVRTFEERLAALEGATYGVATGSGLAPILSILAQIEREGIRRKATLFFGGWSLPWVTYPDGVWGTVLSGLVFAAKTGFFLFLFIWVRWTLPRFRYDQLMDLGWKRLLPLSLVFVMLTAGAVALYVGVTG